MIDKNFAAKRVIEEFEKIAMIPRGSGNEEAIARYVAQWAKENSLEAKIDGVGNVIVTREAAEGFEDAPSVILQSHMDMVCVSKNEDFDAERDAIKLVREGNFIKADGTSLGADDGAGMAMAMYALSEKELKCGKIKGIFTVGEETSMRGAEGFDRCELDAEYLINLDWEDYGSVCSSCANNVALFFEKRCEMQSRGSDSALKIEMEDFAGGHSGCDINLGRANAIKLLAETLCRAEDEGAEIRIAHFRGGSVKNAIPSSAECVVCVKMEDEKLVFDAVREMKEEIAREFRGEEAKIEVCEAQVESVFSAEDSEKLLSMLSAIHSGVYYMSRYTKDFVETSRNVGVAAAEEGRMHVEVLSRSSSGFHSREMKRSASAIARAFGFELSIPEENPIWEEKAENELVEIMKEAFYEADGGELEVLGVHAGLECAHFASVAPNVKMASIGPQLYDVHSVKERWDVSKLDLTMDFLIKTLEKIGGET
ncbi:MAG: beta-Ala-His dipeptidase [Clostridia bacterium]|nr:beta-Ala-His dipeptidase [Clostridia bacterium]